MPLALPPGLTTNDLSVNLRNKVPFCYVVRTQDALGALNSNWGSNRSFYFDIDVPYAGTLRFDGELMLSQQVGNFDMAQTFRVLITSLLCLGLLYRSYKVVERSTGGI